MDMDFVLFIVLFFNCLGLYFIVRSGARGREGQFYITARPNCFAGCWRV